MHILVTGSSGTVGTRLCERLMESHRVTPVDIRPNRWNRKLDALTIQADLREKARLEVLPHDVDLVIHCAANARVYKLVEEPDLACENILTTYNMLEFVRLNGIPRIIFTSSREVYGNTLADSPISEDVAVSTQCESPYAASKVSGEALAYSYHNVYGIGHVTLRLSNVYGRYDDSDRVVPLWIRECLYGRPIVVFGGDKELDFTYLDDTVDGIKRVVERFETVQGNTINISYGKKAGLLAVANMLRELVGSRSEVILKESRSGEIVTFEGDISRARSLLGYLPKVDIREGLRKTVEWYRANPWVFGPA